MTKAQEVMDFLTRFVFDPVLYSKTASPKIKAGVRLTQARMSKLPAESMVRFFWSAIIGTDNSIRMPDAMKAAGLTRFEDVLEQFRVRFDDKWLAS